MCSIFYKFNILQRLNNFIQAINNTLYIHIFSIFRKEENLKNIYTIYRGRLI